MVTCSNIKYEQVQQLKVTQQGCREEDCTNHQQTFCLIGLNEGVVT